MTRRFTITSTQFVGKLALAYNEDGTLTGFFNDAELLASHKIWLSMNFPMTMEQLAKMVAGSRTLVLTETTTLPTFAEFWDAFANKLGNKPKVEKLFNLLTPEEKALAVSAIPAYDAYLRQHPNMEKLYPETYLRQRRFETDYKTVLK